jgi:formylglycine-generating enzyme
LTPLLWMVALACSQYKLIEPDVSGTIDASAESSVPVTDAGTAIEAGSNDASRSACPKSMVFIVAKKGSFCIDAHEVSRSDYAAFVSLKSGDVSGQGPKSLWNKTYVPQAALVGGDVMPIVGVDACDAEAYCSYAGKRLCGRIGGGPLETNTPPEENEWLIACSGDGALRYPYGPSYVEGKCAATPDAGANHSAVSPNACEGGYSGLYDMVGNVWEWVNRTQNVSANGPYEDGVNFVGGAYGYGADTKCDTVSGSGRSYQAADVGFRCCK